MSDETNEKRAPTYLPKCQHCGGPMQITKTTQHRDHFTERWGCLNRLCGGEYDIARPKPGIAETPPTPPITVHQRQAIVATNVLAQTMLGFAGEYGSIVTLNAAVASLARYLHAIDAMLLDRNEPDAVLHHHHALGLQLLDDLRVTWQAEYDVIARRIQSGAAAAAAPHVKTPRKVM